MKPFVFLTLILTICSAESPVLVGAIRWDAWTGILGSTGPVVEATLGPKRWHYRLPFYAQEVSDTAVFVRAVTQAVIDSEIAYAKYGGIDYFAYVLYYSDYLDTARLLHMKSSRKSEVKYCFVMDANAFKDWPSHNDYVISCFKDPDYLKVLDHQPLVYVFQGSGSPEQLRELDSLCLVNGAGDLYIVDMGNELSRVADAKSGYAVTKGSPAGAPFSQMIADAREAWSVPGKCIPLVSAGWDGRPRVEHPAPWAKPEWYTTWYQNATPQEISKELSEAVGFVHGNPKKCEANTVLIYAWNEFDEGGWICPNLAQYGGTARLDAIRKVSRFRTK